MLKGAKKLKGDIEKQKMVKGNIEKQNNDAACVYSQTIEKQMMKQKKKNKINAIATLPSMPYTTEQQ